MNVKKAFTQASAVAALAMASSANAFIIDSGPISIDFRIALVDGVIYNGPCVSVADCNGNELVPATSSFVSPNNAGTGVDAEFDDTWAVFEIESIFNTDTGVNFYVDGQESYDLVGIIYGIVDIAASVDGGSGNINTFSLGGSIEIREVDPINFGTGSAIATDRSAFNVVDGVIDDTDPLWLSANFVENNGFSFGSTVLGAPIGDILGFSGGLLEVTGGSRADVFDTNTATAGADLDLITNLRLLGANGFEFRADGNAEGFAIPAPGTLALFGIALTGLASLRRRRS